MTTSLRGHENIWVIAPQICHQLDISCGKRRYDSGDIVFLICHVTSREHLFKGFCEFIGRIKSRTVTLFPCFVAIGL